jgi:hypothetical protein
MAWFRTGSGSGHERGYWRFQHVGVAHTPSLAPARSLRCVDGITILFAALAALATFVIAAAVIGREAHRLDAVAPRSVYVVDEAVEFVAEHLPPETQARLTPAELEQLLTLHMRWLHAKGLQPTNVVDRRQDIATPVVIAEDTLVGYLLGEAERSGLDILADIDVVNVVDSHHAYFRVIGAVGQRAVDDDLGG